MKWLTGFTACLLPALLALHFSMQYTASQGWRHMQELHSDKYLGYAMSLYRGQDYRNCPLEGYVMCEGDGELSAYRVPGYPLYLTANLVLFGQDDPLAAIRLLQSVLTAGLVFLTAGFALRIAGPVAAMIAGALMMLDEPLYPYTSVLVTEVLFAFMIMIFLHIVVFHRKRGLLIGLLAGSLLLTRGTFSLMFPLILPAIPIRRWLLVILGALVIVVPWTARNWMVFDAFVPFSAGAGQVLYGANIAYARSHANGKWINPLTIPDFAQYARLDEIAQDRALQAATWADLRALPLSALLAHVGRKVLAFLIGLDNAVIASGFLVFVGGVRLLIHHCRIPRYTWVILALWIGLLLNVIIFWGTTRFRFPLDSSMAALAGIAMVRWPKRASEGSYSVSAR